MFSPSASQNLSFFTFLPFYFFTFLLFFVPLRLCLEDRRHLGNENKWAFILHFARFALSLHSNNKTLSFPQLRSFVKLELCHAIQEYFPEAEAVAGVATGAIAQGALVADQLGLPYSYVRPKPKDHGMGNQVEGEIKPGAKVVVVEDLISTGGSSLKAVAALRAYGVEVIGMVASFTYGFPVAEKAFEEAGVKLITLSNYDAVIEEAAKTGYIKEEDKAVLAEWRKSPDTWKQ